MNTVFKMLPVELQENLKHLSITYPTAVQSKVIPLIQSKENILFESETGTGKTFAYMLPLLQDEYNHHQCSTKAAEYVTHCTNQNDYKNSSNKDVHIVICAPTLELASQIRDAIKSISSLNVALLLGGTPIKRQIELLKEKPPIVVGNVARIVELAKLKKLKLASVKAIVFDEVDRLVKKEIINETKNLLDLLPKDVQVIACSATITKQTQNFFSTCTFVKMPQEDVLRFRIEHWAIFSENRNKIETLRKLILALNNSEEDTKSGAKKILIFTSRSDQVQNICNKLNYKNIFCEGLHTKKRGQERKSCVERFRSGKTKILVTSDVASRGLDIPDIEYIIQMDFLSDSDFFIHRAGRTARANKKGVNIVIGNEAELLEYSTLEKKLKLVVYPKIVYGGQICLP
ncbi:MAG: DEAD/DEAH box helicase [Treponema sp.]|nr:DEAD/DEAH box helicase [Treponema sp.]